MQMAVACYTAGGLQPNKSEGDAKTPLLRIKGRDGHLERLTIAAAIFPAFALLLPERIGLKPQARSGEIKKRLFITPILFLPGRCRPACGQQSTVNSQQSTEPRRANPISNILMCQADAQTRGLSKVMKLQKIGLSAPVSILAALTVGEFRFIPNSQFKIINSQALAQTQAQRKAEAERLFNQGIQQYQISQFQAALQSWQQALIIYREIKDRRGEGKALGSLGIAYRSLGDYAKAIEYAQQVLAIAREIKDRQTEGAALGDLGIVYGNLGDYAKAIEYAQQDLAIAREIQTAQRGGG